MRSAGQDMGKGKVSSVLLRLGAPAMISMFFQNLYALVDTIFVGWLGPHPLASLLGWALSAALMWHQLIRKGLSPCAGHLIVTSGAPSW